MSAGSFIGAAVGGTIGWFIGGPLGASIGVGLGAGLGAFANPITPDVPTPGEPQRASLDIPTAQEGVLVADALGTTKIVGQIIWYGGNRSEEITEEQEAGGKGGPEKREVTTGYEYYLSWAVALCMGPVEELLAVYNGDDCVWIGNLRRSEGDAQSIALCGMGSMAFYFGTATQTVHSVITNSLDDATLSPNYRHVCYAFFNDCSLGASNRAPSMSFVIRKSPQYSFSSQERIGLYEYNPVHAIYHCLIELVGLPPDYIDDASYQACADQLSTEGMGVGMLLNQQQEALAYIENILTHIDGVVFWGIDGKLHLKLVRKEDAWSLPEITQDDILDDVSLNRKSWLATVNEIKAQFPEMYFGTHYCGEEDSDIDSDSCTEAGAPSISLVTCTQKRMADAYVDALADGGTTITLDRDVSSDYGSLTEGNIVFEDVQKQILSHSGRDITIASAFIGLVAGDAVCLVTTADTENCEHLGAYYVSGGVEPFYFKLGGKMMKMVGRNFWGKCKDNPCDPSTASVLDRCGQAGNEIELSAICGSCGGQFPNQTVSMRCGEHREFTISNADECCVHRFEHKGPGDIVRTDTGTVMYNAPSLDGDGHCCISSIATIKAYCCGALLGQATINISCGCSSASIGYTSLNMQCDAQQTFDVMGAADQCEYSWQMSGGGDLSVAESGRSATYTAPSSNEGCNHNATIMLLCCGAIVDSVTLAVNCYTGSYAVYAYKQLTGCSLGGPSQATGMCWTVCGYTIDYYDCAGNLVCAYSGDASLSDWKDCGAEPSCDSCCENAGAVNDLCTDRSRQGCGWIDMRNQAEKDAGCCPYLPS